MHSDAEKMEHLPSEGNTEHKRHEIKIVASYYEDVVSGKKGFELRKNDRGYKQGDSLKMLEFKDGKHTGRTIDADIIYMLEDYTGLTEGYCILGIRVTDYTGKALAEWKYQQYMHDYMRVIHSIDRNVWRIGMR